MEREILLISDDKYSSEIECEFAKRGFTLMNNNDNCDGASIVFCYKVLGRKMMEEINRLNKNYMLLVLIPDDRNIKSIYCDKPTLFIQNDGSDAIHNAFNLFGNISDISFVVKNIVEWADILLADINRFGMPCFNKIKAEEISCRMISFDDQYPAEFKLV